MIRRSTLLLLPLLLAGCASAPRDPAALAAYRANNDPFEPLNRKVFAFDQGLDRAIIRPAAETYVNLVPGPFRDGIHNFLANFAEPLVLANNLLQAQFGRAGITTERFIVNSTIGVAGLSDYAGRHGLHRQVGDFGQTLYTWGFPSGPYLMLPLFGPSNPRDGIGQGVDLFGDPFRYVARRYNYPNVVTTGKVVVEGVDLRARNLETFDEMKKESIDFYATLRSLFRQNRASELRGGGLATASPADDLYSDPDSSGPAGK